MLKPDEISKEQWVEALLALRPFTATHRALLKAHFQSPQFTTTATKLAKAMEWKNYSAANLHYGALAERFCEYFHTKPKCCLDLLVDAYKLEDDPSETQLTLRRALIDALTELRWYKA